jgi:hypothetical protein
MNVAIRKYRLLLVLFAMLLLIAIVFGLFEVSRLSPVWSVRLRGWEVRYPESTEGSDVAYVRYHGDVVRAKDVSILAKIPLLSCVEITAKQWEPGALSMLSSVSSLRILDVSGITDSDAQALAPMNLVVLKITDSPKFADPGLVFLRGMTSLKQLDLPYTGVTDRGLATIGQIKSLESLYLGRMLVATSESERCPISDVGVAELQSLGHLKSLHLTSTQVSDAGLQYIAHLHALEFLDLAGTRVTLAGLKALTPLTSVDTLFVMGTGIRTSDAATIRNVLPRLERLEADTPDSGVQRNSLPAAPTMQPTSREP